MTERASRPLYPFLVAPYPPLALAAQNAGESVEPLAVALAIGSSLFVAAVAWLASIPLTRDPHRRALLSLLGVLLFNGFGYVDVAIRRSAISPYLDPFDTLFAIVLVVVVAAIAIVRSRRPLADVSRYLVVVATVLLLMPVGTLIVHAARPAARLPLDPIPTPTAAREPRRDVWILVLDKYTSSRALRANYGFDNSAFEEALRARGFVVPADARANYPQTFLALGSMLNWQYLDSAAARLGHRSHDRRPVHRLVEENRTAARLRGAGYRYVFFPTSFPATARSRQADVQLPRPGLVASEYLLAWLATTPVPVVRGMVCRIAPCAASSQGSAPYPPESAERLDWRFRELATLARAPGPKLVFAHLLVPHEPYVYDASCAHREPYWPMADSAAEAPRVKAAYLAQITCVNRRLLAVVDSIRARSATPPIIILQSDHGHGRMGRHQPQLRDAPAERVDERLSIFAAYHLPDGGASIVHDSVTPVSVFRGVMRHYFGVPLAPLADRSYWSADESPYAMTRLR